MSLLQAALVFIAMAASAGAIFLDDAIESVHPIDYPVVVVQVGFGWES